MKEKNNREETLHHHKNLQALDVVVSAMVVDDIVNQAII